MVETISWSVLRSEKTKMGATWCRTVGAGGGNGERPLDRLDEPRRQEATLVLSWAVRAATVSSSHAQRRGRRRSTRGDRSPHPRGPGRAVLHPYELLAAPAEQVLDRARDELGLGRVVMELRPARQPGSPRDLGRARAGVAQVVQARDRRIEQPGARPGAPLGLGPTVSPIDGRYLSHALVPMRQKRYSQA
jgi:hypothetical protein